LLAPSSSAPSGGPGGAGGPGAPRAPEPELHTRLVWLTFFRIVANSLFLVAIAARLVPGPARELSLADTLSFGVSAAVYVSTLAYALRLRRGQAERHDAWTHVAVDVLLATALVYLSGGADSPYTFTFSLAVIEAALLLDRRGALVTAAASSLAFGGLLLALQTGLVVSPLAEGPVPDRRAVFVMGSNTLAVTLVAVLAGYLSRQLSAAGGRLVAQEQDLRRMAELQRQILSAMPSGLLTGSGQGVITFANPAAGAMLGRRPEQLQGTPLEAVLPGVLTLGPVAPRRELTVDTPAGERRLGLSVSPLEREAGTLLIVFQDLTELRRVEDDLRRADRLAALGKMAAQLAHEIRNPLASMRGSAQLLASELPPDGTGATLTRILVRESDRLSRLVGDVLRFARPQEPARQRVDLGRLVEEVLVMLRTDPLAAGVDVRISAPPLQAAVDPDQLRQVLLNLARNALQAAGPGGRVRAEVEGRPGEALVRVWDSGGGILPAHMPRLFEPFFSTRDGGTGLGLSTARAIVMAHGGDIQVRSSPEQGTELLVRLPLQEDAPAPERAQGRGQGEAGEEAG
jgi:two-component system sensor histidine kinase PilS (NtrC family)